jgi:alpha-L-rhamnosidase
LLARLTIKTADGKTTTVLTDGSWRCTDQAGDNWQDETVAVKDWPACRVLGEYGCKPWGKLRLSSKLFLPPPPYLRTTFQADKPIRRATVHVTALGVCDLYLNGQRVSDDFFNPGWTDYTKRVYYRTYDVTPLLRQGKNAFGAILADGWYSGYVAWNKMRNHYGKKPRLRAQVHVEYADGSSAVIATGPDWKASTGPTREADFQMGEVYDARLELDGWDQPGFDDTKWDKVDTGAEVKPLVQAHPGPPVRAFSELKPVNRTEPKPGAFVYDLGQNFAGVVRLKVRGKAGQKITLRFAERLSPDGTVYTANLRDARATDTYICKGSGLEVWEPRFTYHGFQYVELTGFEGKPDLDALVAVALSSDTPVAGTFACSDAMLNQLYKNVYWTQRANFIDIPTDCPQRDERLGWTGDAQIYLRTATLNTDVQAFFTKWLVDLEDGQRADGQFPWVAPANVAGDDGGPAWADAGVICPWTIYEVYGDRRVLECHYASMTRFIEFCRQRSTPELLPPERFHAFGDWLSINADTPKEVIYTAYFAYSAHLTARAAAALGNKEDAAKYEALYEKVKTAFNKAYVQPDGRIKGDTQTCYVVALMADLLDGERQKQAAHHLVENIEKREGRLSTGFVGTKDLMLVLAKIGRNDVAYRLVHNDSFPSWGYTIKQGATSIWERWDGCRTDRGFQDPSMCSFSHYSFGAVYQWMAENIGGIHSDGLAYRKIVIAPQLDEKLTMARVGYCSIHGSIESAWQREGNRLVLSVTIPANTTATVILPTTDATSVREGDRPVKEADGVKVIGTEKDRVTLALGSGRYQLTCTVPATK